MYKGRWRVEPVRHVEFYRYWRSCTDGSDVYLKEFLYKLPLGGMGKPILVLFKSDNYYVPTTTNPLFHSFTIAFNYYKHSAIISVFQITTSRSMEGQLMATSSSLTSLPIHIDSSSGCGARKSASRLNTFWSAPRMDMNISGRCLVVGMKSEQGMTMLGRCSVCAFHFTTSQCVCSQFHDQSAPILVEPGDVQPVAAMRQQVTVA